MSSERAKASVAAVYEFRLTKGSIDTNEMISELKKIAKKFVFQLEKGEKTGYVHYQGRVSLIKKTTKSAALDLFEKLSIPAPEYLKPTITEEHQKAAFYCMKEQTRIEGPWTDKDTPSYIPYQYRNIQLREFQREIIETRKVFDPRGIDLLYDAGGNKGKSYCAAIGELLYGAIDLPPINDAKQLLEVMYGECIMRDTRKPGLVFIDMPRATCKDTLNGIYSAIEQIKTGKIYDIRHTFKSWWIDSPRIWVFTNALPDPEALSADRWRYWEIKEDKLVKYEPPGEVVNKKFKKRLV